MNAVPEAGLARGPEPWRARFSLSDHNGAVADAERFRGCFALVFFGFTHCQVVCPRALARLEGLACLMERLGRPVQPLYITVDPGRDTPQRMTEYLQPRFPHVLGLTGSADALAEARGVFRVFAGRRPDSHSGYAMPHTAITYVVDPGGWVIDHWPDTFTQAQMAERLAALSQVPRSSAVMPVPASTT